MTFYLKRDVTGRASGIEYAKSGDRVLLLNTDINREMVLVENKGNRFFVFPDDLSENKIEDERQKIVERIQPVHKAKRRR